MNLSLSVRSHLQKERKKKNIFLVCVEGGGSLKIMPGPGIEEKIPLEGVVVVAFYLKNLVM